MESRALDTLKIILKNRGVEDAQYEAVSNPIQETHMYTYGGVLVVFSEKTRLSEKDFNNYIEFAQTNGFSNGIVMIVDSKPSASVLNVIRRHIADPANVIVQVFELRHLQLDISAHRKVPKHRILMQDEIDSVLKEFHASSPSVFPKIDSQDPMVRWIGARPGNVLEITGLCEASGDNRRYRLCVENAVEA